MIRTGQMNVRINQIPVIFLPEKALFLPGIKMLCIADWHLGKAAHFRKSGIPVPQPGISREFTLIENLLETHEAEQVLFLGDLFHSVKNNDWHEFAGFVRNLPQIKFKLVKGNHDIIPARFFEELGIEAADSFTWDNRVIFTHEPLYDRTPEGMLNVAGHVHPGYSVRLNASQGVVLPCFHYSNPTLLLPAFGELTGFYRVEKGAGQEVYCVLGNEVIPV